MKIYLITSGEYSDYGIYGAFSSEDNAKAAIEKAKDVEKYWASEAGVEEYEIDEMLRFEHVTSWKVAIDLENGTLLSWYRMDLHDRPSHTFEKPFRTDTSEEIVSFDGRARKRVRSTVSFEHACKLAAEWRQGYLRETAQMPTICQNR